MFEQGENAAGKIAVRGIKIGHAQDAVALTGCTVILCEDGAVCGIDRRGGGTTTRQADAFEPWHLVQKVFGVLLTGGSAFGLGALGGVLRYLEEREIGFDTFVAKVPIVAAAGLFDLGIGDGSIRPDPHMAYKACVQASDGIPEEGCVGAGMGATVGKVLGLQQAMKSGIGRSSIRVGPDLVVEAIVAVNASGDVIDPETGTIIAGARLGDAEDGSTFADAMQVLEDRIVHGSAYEPVPQENTVIGVVYTNARLSKIQATKVAQMAHDGLARAVRPAHMMFDGDTMFALATGEVQVETEAAEAEASIVGAFAAEAVGRAIVRAVRAARSMGGLPATADLALSKPVT